MQRTHSKLSQQGVMLLEALIGILIFSIGILSMVAMHALAIGYASDAKYRSDASFLANELIGQIWIDRSNLNNYAYPGGTAAALDPWVAKVNNYLPGSVGGNAPSVAVDLASGQVDITIRWQPPNADMAHSYRSMTRVTNP